jgi:hypothetical protein
MHYGTFAKAVAKVLQDEYGSHNYEPFIKELNNALKVDLTEIDDTVEYRRIEQKLKNDIIKASGEDDVYVMLRSYSDKGPKREKGFGEVRFRIKNAIDPTAFEQVKNLLKAKGYEITSDSNWYDEDEDRMWYPTIKFEFDI